MELIDVDNDLVCSDDHGVEYGDVVSFELQHICAIEQGNSKR